MLLRAENKMELMNPSTWTLIAGICYLINSLGSRPDDGGTGTQVFNTTMVGTWLDQNRGRRIMETGHMLINSFQIEEGILKMANDRYEMDQRILARLIQTGDESKTKQGWNELVDEIKLKYQHFNTGRDPHRRPNHRTETNAITQRMRQLRGEEDDDEDGDVPVLVPDVAIAFKLVNPERILKGEYCRQNFYDEADVVELLDLRWGPKESAGIVGRAFVEQMGSDLLNTVPGRKAHQPVYPNFTVMPDERPIEDYFLRINFWSLFDSYGIAAGNVWDESLSFLLPDKYVDVTRATNGASYAAYRKMNYFRLWCNIMSYFDEADRQDLKKKFRQGVLDFIRTHFHWIPYALKPKPWNYGYSKQKDKLKPVFINKDLGNGFIRLVLNPDKYPKPEKEIKRLIQWHKDNPTWNPRTGEVEEVF